MKALIITWEKYQDHEVIYPYYRVQEDGYEVDIMSNVVGKIHGILGTYMDSTKSVFDLNDEGKFQEYLKEFTSKKSMGNRGYLAKIGLVPLASDKYKVTRTAALDLNTINIK